MNMSSKKISLAKQIKKVIGNRVLYCSLGLMFIIVALTVYDISISFKQLSARISEKIKPIEEFAINQAIIDNLDAIDLKIESFNENNPNFHVEWVRNGGSQHRSILWSFPFSWIYNYPIGQISGYQFGYFKINGGLLSDKTLVYDLLFRLSLLLIFVISVLSILYPLAKKIPEQLFLKPINRFIDLISNNSIQNEIHNNALPVELELLESRILSLLKTATDHERNKATTELGYLSARLVHDIRSPLAAMEMGLCLLMKQYPLHDFSILSEGIQSIRDIANNVLDRYRNTKAEIDSPVHLDDGNVSRPLTLEILLKQIISQKNHEWLMQPCDIKLIIKPSANQVLINVAPNEIKRLFSNLLNNSYEAITNKCTGLIQIYLAIEESDLHVALHDNGVGIPFEKMKEVLNGVSLKPGGNGLGLSAAKQFVEKMKGKFELSSYEGLGTRIDMFFPFLINDDSARIDSNNLSEFT